MYADARVAVVVTAYEEAAFVGDVVESVPAFVDRIYVVDDASRDGSWSVIRDVATRVNRAADSRRVVPLRHATNRGYGGAVKTGYRRAVADGMEVVAVMNGDGQMDPAILDRIIAPVVAGETHYAKGNRLLTAADRAEMSTFRLVGNVALSALSRVASGYWRLGDPQNGYTAISAEAIEHLEFDRLTDEYGFLNDVLVELNVHGLRVADVPMRAKYGAEESGIRLARFVPRVSRLLARSFLRRVSTRYLVRDFHPAVLYYALAAGGAILAFLLAVTDRRPLSVSPLSVAGLAFAMAVERDAAANEPLQSTADEHSDPIEADWSTSDPPAPDQRTRRSDGG